MVGLTGGLIIHRFLMGPELCVDIDGLDAMVFPSEGRINGANEIKTHKCGW